jgi:hypothetical protein
MEVVGAKSPTVVAARYFFAHSWQPNDLAYLLQRSW